MPARINERAHFFDAPCSIAAAFPERNIMNNVNKVALLIATAALAACATGGAPSSTKIDNWRASDGTVVKNGSNEYCWRDSNWTPPTGVQGCDGVPPPPAPVVPVAPAPAPAPVAAPVAPAVVPVPVPVAPTSEKVTFAADALFDFDKAVLKPDAATKLDDLVGKVKTITLEVIIAVGHTDSKGSDAYNQKLSVKRAEAIKAYLTGKGIEASRVYTEGKGESQPVADNATDEGRARNRRVEIEVVGTRAK
jgi:OmpA-OmpF porin, OOP family